jgi:Centromere DNA-binding protein complex CBF3 subunit, domain 2
MCRIFVFDNGKTDSTGRKLYLGSIRHRDPLVCPIDALAFSLFTQFHYKEGREHALNEKTHREWINRVFEGIGFSSSKSTHASKPPGREKKLHISTLRAPLAYKATVLKLAS